MNRRFFLANLSVCAVLPRASDGADSSGLSASELVEFTPLSQGVSRASTLTLYEGLPHPDWEAEYFKMELATKKTVRLHDYSFYERPLHVAAEDIETLRRLSANPDSYWSYRGPKPCGRYHPDYCLAWKDYDSIYDFLICFGCEEMKLYGPEGHLLVDLRSESALRFKITLQNYRNERPR